MFCGSPAPPYRASRSLEKNDLQRSGSESIASASIAYPAGTFVKKRTGTSLRFLLVVLNSPGSGRPASVYKVEEDEAEPEEDEDPGLVEDDKAEHEPAKAEEVQQQEESDLMLARTPNSFMECSTTQQIDTTWSVVPRKEKPKVKMIARSSTEGHSIMTAPLIVTLKEQVIEFPDGSTVL